MKTHPFSKSAVRQTPYLKRNPALSKINVQQNAVNFICNYLTHLPFYKKLFLKVAGQFSK
jgi:hypothetical protein